MTAVMRQVVAVAGVLVLEWPARDVAVFFVLESWLFMSFRAAAEVALDERTPGHGLLQTALYTAGYVLAALPFMGALLGCVAGLAIIPAFPAEEWEAFKTTGSRQSSFQAAVAFLAASIAFDTARHLKRAAAGRTRERRLAAQREVRLVTVRMLLLVAGSVALGASAGSVDKALALVVAIAVVVVLIEALPERFGRMLPAPPEPEPPEPAEPAIGICFRSPAPHALPAVERQLVELRGRPVEHRAATHRVHQDVDPSETVITSSAMLVTLSGSSTSPSIARPLPFAAAMRRSTSVNRSRATSTTATFAPSLARRTAVAAPMPLAPPVITATLSEKRI